MNTSQAKDTSSNQHTPQGSSQSSAVSAPAASNAGSTAAVTERKKPGPKPGTKFKTPPGPKVDKQVQTLRLEMGKKNDVIKKLRATITDHEKRNRELRKQNAELRAKGPATAPGNLIQMPENAVRSLVSFAHEIEPLLQRAAG